MKKRTFILMVVLLLVGAVWLLLPGGGDTGDAQRIFKESSLYTAEEIWAAMDVAERKFKKDFDDCELLQIAYDEEKTLAEQAYRTEKGSMGEVIVLVSDFRVGDHAEPTFSPNQTYENWQWILERNDGRWKLVGYGYG